VATLPEGRSPKKRKEFGELTKRSSWKGTKNQVATKLTRGKKKAKLSPEKRWENDRKEETLLKQIIPRRGFPEKKEYTTIVASRRRTWKKAEIRKKCRSQGEKQKKTSQAPQQKDQRTVKDHGRESSRL